MIRCPSALEKMRYDKKSGMVIYRSRLHAALKRNYQLTPALKWLRNNEPRLPLYRWSRNVGQVSWRYASNSEIENIFATMFDGYFDNTADNLSDSRNGAYADQLTGINLVYLD